MKKKLTFEQSLDRLEEIAALLEQGNTPLEDALKLYEEASALAAQCRKQLSQVQLRITELSEINEVQNMAEMPDKEEEDG